MHWDARAGLNTCFWLPGPELIPACTKSDLTVPGPLLAWAESCNGHGWERLEKSLQDMSPGTGEGCGATPRQRTETSVKEAGQDKKIHKNRLKNNQVWTGWVLNHHNNCTSIGEDAYDTSQPPPALFFLSHIDAVDLRAQGDIGRVNITPQKKI